MRWWKLPFLVLLLGCLGCGGGGAGEDAPEEVVLAVWPFEQESTSSDPFDRLTVGFTGERAPSLLGDPVLLAVDVVDGQEGLQERIDGAAGGSTFGDQAARLTDGLDSILMVRVTNGNGASSGRLQRESDALQAFVPAAPDLAGARVTAFQLDLVRTSIEQGPITPTEKQGEGHPAVTIGTTVRIEGEVRILGIPATAD